MNLPTWAEHTPDYAFMMRDAHRKPAQAICPPALSWHLALLRPPRTSDRDWYLQIESRVLETLAQCARTATSEGMAGFVQISNLHQEPIELDSHTTGHTERIVLLRNTYEYTALKAQRDEDASEEPRQRYETVVIGGNWRGFGYWIRFEVFEEYYTITSTLHSVLLQRKESPAKCMPVNSAASPLTKYFALIADVANARYQSLEDSQLPLPDRTLGEPLSDASRHLYEQVWSDFKSELLGDSGTKVVAFADFRGLVLPVRPSEVVSHQCSAIDGSSNASTTLSNRMLGPASHLDERAATQWGSRWAEAILPVLIAQEMGAAKKPRVPPFEVTEYTFSRFSGNRYIYGSGFGSQQAYGPSQRSSGAPLCFVLLSFHDEWRQVGRTVLRVNTLGTLRIAALFELRRLMGRDHILSRLEGELRHYDSVREYSELRNEQSAALRRLAEILPILRNEAIGSAIPEAMVAKICRLGSSDNFKDFGVPLIAVYWIQRWFRKRDVHAAFVALDRIRKAVKKVEPSSEARSERLELVREAIRCCRIYHDSNNLVQYRSTRLYLVRRAIAGMDSVNRDGGITYRAARSKYLRDLWETLAESLRIERIPGYQPYTVFVRHRLDRAYGLVQAIDARFQQIVDIEASLRHRLERERARGHQRVLKSLQDSAEVGFWLVLAPYYVGHISEALFHTETALLTGTASALAAGLAWVIYRRVHRVVTKPEEE